MSAQRLPFFKLAWRNIWRNKRRAFLTIGGLTLLNFILLWMIWFGFGAHDGMLDNYVRILTGHIQIHAKGFNEDMSVMKRIRDPQPILEAIAGTKHVTGTSVRIKSSAMAAAKGNSAGGFLLAFDPEREKTVSNMYKSIKTGSYLSSDRRGEVVIGYQLASNLSIGIGDEIAVLVQAADGSLGAKKFKVVGLADPGIAELDNTLIMMNLADAQDLLAYGHAVNEIIVMVDDSANVPVVDKELQKKIDTNIYEVLPWYIASPELKQLIDLDWASFILMMIAVGAVAILGIMNSLLMSLFERVREFGVMMAMGIRPRQITRLVLTESMLMTLVSIVIGFTLALGAAIFNTYYGMDIRYFGSSELFAQWGMANVIFFAKINWDGFWIALGSVVGMAFLSSLYPAIHTARLKPVEAMKFD
jgi:putative ABC transport system permease protein